MAWYAYCIGEKTAFPELARHRKPVPLESVLGVSGNQVFLYPASDLAVLVSEHNPAETLNQKSGVDHARVIADCFQHSTVLPFRFGTVFNDDEGLRKSIRSNQRQFQNNIDKLRGKTEMHLKIFVDDCSHSQERYTPAEGVGREYLSNLRENAARTRERQTRARAVSFQMHRLFAPLDEDISCRLTESGKMVLDIAHLIDRKCVERYQNKFATTSATMMRECQMQVSGPWPPYHFVHRLTRSGHAQSAAPVPVPAPAPTTAPLAALANAIPAMA